MCVSLEKETLVLLFYKVVVVLTGRLGFQSWFFEDRQKLEGQHRDLVPSVSTPAISRIPNCYNARLPRPVSLLFPNRRMAHLGSS